MRIMRDATNKLDDHVAQYEPRFIGFVEQGVLVGDLIVAFGTVAPNTVTQIVARRRILVLSSLLHFSQMDCTTCGQNRIDWTDERTLTRTLTSDRLSCGIVVVPLTD